MPLWVRPQMFPPDHTVTTLSSFSCADVSIENGILGVVPSGLSSQPEAWVLSSGAVSAAGQPVTAVPEECMQVARGKASHDDLLACMASHGIWVGVTYQPASRYWAFYVEPSLTKRPIPLLRVVPRVWPMSWGLLGSQ